MMISKERDERVVLFLDARVKSNLTRAITQLMRHVVDALCVVLVGDVQVAVVLHCAVLPSSTTPLTARLTAH